MTARHVPAREPIRTRVSLATTIGLVIIWMLLWGELSFGAAAFGLVIALGVQLVFPLPVVPELERTRPWGFLVLIATTGWGLVTASFAVAITVLAFWRPTRNAIVRVELTSDSPFVTAITADLVTLVPGSVVVDADDGWLLVHVFDAATPEALAAAEDEVLRTERRVLGAFGTEPRSRHDAGAAGEER